jgi:hypothetical protein
MGWLGGSGLLPRLDSPGKAADFATETESPQRQLQQPAQPLFRHGLPAARRGPQFENEAGLLGSRDF